VGHTQLPHKAWVAESWFKVAEIPNIMVEICVGTKHIKILHIFNMFYFEKNINF